MEETNKDKWQFELGKALVELQNCQREKNLNSCMSCKEILVCTTKEQYVRAVYESMNKGSGGGFEF